jgi:hypothetical protein
MTRRVSHVLFDRLSRADETKRMLALLFEKLHERKTTLDSVIDHGACIDSSTTKHVSSRGRQPKTKQGGTVAHRKMRVWSSQRDNFCSGMSTQEWNSLLPTAHDSYAKYATLNTVCLGFRFKKFLTIVM